MDRNNQVKLFNLNLETNFWLILRNDAVQAYVH